MSRFSLENLKRAVSTHYVMLIFGLVVGVIIPFIIGGISYHALPDNLPTHFGFYGDTNDYTSKGVFLFGIPLVMFALFFLVNLFVYSDPLRANQYARLNAILLGSIPVMTLVIVLLVVGISLGMPNIVIPLFSFLMSILVILVGNYLPKLKRNYSVGIKLPWTLKSDYVWYKTHLVSGRLLMLVGVVALILNVAVACYNYAHGGITSTVFNHGIVMVGLVIALIVISIIGAIYAYVQFKHRPDYELHADDAPAK